MNLTDFNAQAEEDFSEITEDTQDQERPLEAWVKPTIKSMPLDQATADPYGYSGYTT